MLVEFMRDVPSAKNQKGLVEIGRALGRTSKSCNSRLWILKKKRQQAQIALPVAV